MDVVVQYHHENGGFWADSSGVPGFTAAGATLGEVRALVQEGIPFYLETDDVQIYEVLASYELPVVEIHTIGAQQAGESGTVGSFTEVSRSVLSFANGGMLVA